MPNAELYTIRNVEIFSVGTWNGDEWTVEDLDKIVDAYNETKGTFKPYLKIGHNEEQELAKEIAERDGQPAIGWISNLYRLDDKLYADFEDVPRTLFNLINKKAYRKVSVEIYLDVKIKDEKFKYMLGAVSLLGADTPAVMNLDDILSMYGLKGCESIKVFAENKNEFKVKSYSFANSNFMEEDRMPKTEKEIELEAQLKQEQKEKEALEAKLKKFSSDQESSKSELEQLKAKLEEAEKKAHASEAKAREVELDKQVDDLLNEKLITKGMRPYVRALLGEETKDVSGVKKYSFKSAEDKDVELTKAELIKEIAKLYSKASDVNFDENSEDGDKKQGNGLSEKEVEAYSKEKKISFSEAYRELLRGKATKEDGYESDEEDED